MHLLICLPQLVAETEGQVKHKGQENPKPNRAPVRHSSGGFIENLDERRDGSSGVNSGMVQGARCEECARQDGRWR